MSTNYTAAQAERAVYRAYLEALNELDEQSKKHLKACIHESIRVDITPKQREYLTLYMSGYNISEVAILCGVGKPAVSRALHRAFDNLFEHVRYATPYTLKASDRVRKYLTGIYK